MHQHVKSADMNYGSDLYLHHLADLVFISFLCCHVSFLPIFRMYICVNVHVYAGTQVCAHGFEGQRATLGVNHQTPFTLYFRQVILLVWSLLIG